MNKFKPTTMAVLIVMSMFALSAARAEAVETPQERKWLIDDFQDGDSVSALGTQWQALSDRVMGGRSDIEAQIGMSEGKAILTMRGKVSLENNGGFIQVRLPLGNAVETLDASDYSGFYITVRGIDGPYFAHLRTWNNRAPWSYYSAEINVTENWYTVRIPWSEFQPESTLRSSPDIENLVSLGIVAAKEEFQADLDISELGLYRSMNEN